MEDPEATMPNAAARRRLNQVAVFAAPGTNKIPTASPAPTPCDLN
jgi:hypothetical protein